MRCGDGLPVSLLLMAVAAASSSTAAAEPPAGLVHHDLAVHLDPASGWLRGEDRVQLPAAGTYAATIAEQYEIAQISLDDETLPAGITSAGRRSWRIDASAPGPHTLVLRYAGRLASLQQMEHRDTLGELPAM